MGGNIYNTDGSGQTIAGGTVPGQKLTFIVTLKNNAQVSDLLKLRGPAQSGTWSLKYFDKSEGGVDISALVSDEGWNVQGALQPGSSHEIRVEVSPGASTLAGSGPTIPITLASGASSQRDVVKIDTRFQKLAGIEYSVDGEETWQAVPSGTGFISVEQSQVISFRAVKADADGDWPHVPEHPVVQWIGGHFRHHGEVTSVMFEKLAVADAVETVTADGGNTLSARVKVLAPSEE